MVDLRLFWLWAVVRMREEHFPAYFVQLDRIRLISNIKMISLSQEQVETALVKLAESEQFKLSKLSLKWRDSSSSVLSRALVKIEEVVVKSTFCSPETAVRSLEDLCETIVRCENLKIRKLKMKIDAIPLPDSDLPPPSASPELLSAALVRLEEIDIDFKLNSEQLEALATKICQEKNLKLETLRLNRNFKLDQVSPVVLSRSIIRLKEIPSPCIRAGRTVFQLSPQQIACLFQTLQDSEEEEEEEEEEVRLAALDLQYRRLTGVPSASPTVTSAQPRPRRCSRGWPEPMVGRQDLWISAATISPLSRPAFSSRPSTLWTRLM